MKIMANVEWRYVFFSAAGDPRPREVSWKEAFPVETPLPPPRLPKDRGPKVTVPQKLTAKAPKNDGFQ